MGLVRWGTVAIQEVLILLAVARTDWFVVGKPLQSFLSPFIQLLPSSLGRRLIGATLSRESPQQDVPSDFRK
jgi:hypothetical protein